MKYAAFFFVPLIAACGIRVPAAEYDKRIVYPSNGEPENLERLVQKYPALKGRVMTAEQWMEIYEKRLKAAQEAGQPAFDLRIQSGTVLNIEIEDEPKLSERVTVGPHGYYEFKHIGKVMMLGRSLDELKQELEARYSEYLRDPKIRINAEATPVVYQTLPGFAVQGPNAVQAGEILVFGAVSSMIGQALAFTGRETILSILSKTGFTTGFEWRKVRIVRRDPKDPLHSGYIVFVDLWKFFAEADWKQNVPMLPGDIVYVPRSWTTDDEVRSEFTLIGQYLSGLLTLDSFKDAFRKKTGGAFRD